MHVGLHHAEKRKKAGSDDRFDRIMIGVGLIGPFSLLPQVIEVWINKSIVGISLTSWTLLMIVAFIWVAYGITRRSKAIIISNMLLGLFDLLVVLGVLLLR